MVAVGNLEPHAWAVKRTSRAELHTCCGVQSQSGAQWRWGPGTESKKKKMHRQQKTSMEA